MSTRDELALSISAYKHNSEVAWKQDEMLADHLIAEGWRKMPGRDELSNFLFRNYERGTRSKAFREADAILAFLDGGQ